MFFYNKLVKGLHYLQLYVIIVTVTDIDIDDDLVDRR